MPKALTAPATGSYSKTQFNKDVDEYRRAAMGVTADASKGISAIPPDLPRALTLRNQIAYRVMADIESSYAGFEMKLTSSRAAQNTLSDTTVQGLTVATGLVGAGDVKDILAATSSAFQGSWHSYDKNFFREKTTESIISQMRASRKTKQAELIKSLNRRDLQNYPWDAVWIDLVDFYYAGTVPSALVDISSGTGAKANDADKILKDTVKGLTLRTPGQAIDAMKVRSAFDKLTAATADPAKSVSAIESLKRILTAIGHPPSDKASAEELLILLKAAMIEAKTDDDKFAALVDAVAAEKLE